MLTKKLAAGVTLVALLGSDLGLGVVVALGQTTGNGPMPVPSLTDGALGSVPPGASAPYQQQPQLQPQPIPQRQFPPAPANLCQPGAARSYQTVSVPRTRAPQVPQGQVAQGPQLGGATVTQVTVTQSAPGQAAQAQGADLGRPGAGQTQMAGVPEPEDLSRIEAVFNLDPIRQFTVPMGTEQIAFQRHAGQQPGQAQTELQQQQVNLQQQTGDRAQLMSQLPYQPPAMLGPYGAPLRQYGYAMFASNVSTFAPVDDIPVGPDYVLGPGDDLTINVWGAVDSTLVKTVDRNGRIVLPKVGDLRIWGLTFAQADRLIREQLSRYFRGFQTSVTMGRLRTVSVHVVGEVCQPGAYTLSALSTVTNALFSAGGPTKLGTLRDVRLIRGTSQVAKLDLYDFLQRGDRTRDFRLESGDTIFVPTIGDVVAVAGEVKRPAIYEVHSTTRLSDTVELAGGVTPTGYLRRVQIVRSLPSAERVTLDVDLTGYYLKGDEASNPPVNAGYLVLIHRSDPRVYNTVKVDGAVKYPGSYELKPMMRISQLLPAERLLPEAYPERVEVARRRPDLSLEVVPVNLKKAWTGDPEQDLLLRPLDEVVVRTELKPAQSVTLTGQIVRPGVYTVAEGERLSSVLARAGGFTDRASLKSAVFTRASLRKIEQEQLDAFVKAQEQRILSTASTVVVGADKEEAVSQQAATQARREMLKLLASKVAVGRMVVHLDAPDKLKGTDNDVVLIEGDTLDVPEPAQSVLVLGAVRNATSVQFKPGASVDYYINRVGGFSKEADRKEAYIAKADGSAMASFTNVRDVEPGDSIIVPPKSEEKTRWLPTFSSVAQIIGSTLLGLAALTALGL
jgi:protein involved in polysaccharide export with SLBB domain